ncbi:MAG: Lsm family RNA-binding protein [Desulfurococcaceae archaeon]
MSVLDATRRFISTLQSMLDKKVSVVLVDGKAYKGTLHAFEQSSLSIVLSPAIDVQGRSYQKIIIRGDRVSEIMLEEESVFNPEEFAEYIKKRLNLRDDAVKVIPEANAVQILNRILIRETGVEGTGPLAETTFEVFQEYMEKKRKRE